MISIHLSTIRKASILLLALPVYIFLIFWIKPLISIPACILLGIAIFLSRKSEDKVLTLKASHLLILAVIVTIWTFMSGQGGFFTQSGDQFYRNPIFRDLINYSWPVRYQGPRDESLVYYIGYWLVPATIGKIFTFFSGFKIGYLISRIALLVWSNIFIYLTILLLYFKLNQNHLKKMLIVAMVFILFSGMDILGLLISNSPDPHIENWATVFTYSSMSTQLIDAFNQAIPTWLAMALILNEKDEKAYALIGLLLLSSSPLPLVGIVFYMIYIAVKNIISDFRKGNLSQRIKTIISPNNVLATIVLFPIYWIYYDNNIAIESGVTVSTTTHNASNFSTPIISTYIAFILLEFAILLLLIANKKNRFDSIFVGITLCLIPFLHVGWSTDFCMRASIPILFLLVVMLMEYFLSIEKINNLKQVIVIVVFIIGACNALYQYGISTTTYINSHGDSAKMYDTLSGLSELPLEYKGNFVGVDSENTLFYRYLARK